MVADLHGGDASDAAVLGGLVTGQERTFRQDPLFAFRLLADIGLRALSPAVNDPATAVQALDTIQSLLVPLVTRDLDVAEIADRTGGVKVVLALPSWDDYLRTALDDLIESASRSPMVLLQARTLLVGLLNAAPPQRRPSITWRLQHAEELTAGNFPLIWRHVAGGGTSPAASGPSTASRPEGAHPYGSGPGRIRQTPDRAGAQPGARPAAWCSPDVPGLAAPQVRAVQADTESVLLKNWYRRRHSARPASVTARAGRPGCWRPPPSSPAPQLRHRGESRAP